MLNLARYEELKGRDSFKLALSNFKRWDEQDLANFISDLYLDKNGKNLGPPEIVLRNFPKTQALEAIATKLMSEIKALGASKNETQEAQRQMENEKWEKELKFHEEHDGLIVSRQHPGKSSCDSCKHFEDKGDKNNPFRFAHCNKLGIEVSAGWTCDRYEPIDLQATLGLRPVGSGSERHLATIQAIPEPSLEDLGLLPAKPKMFHVEHLDQSTDLNKDPAQITTDPENPQPLDFQLVPTPAELDAERRTADGVRHSMAHPERRKVVFVDFDQTLTLGDHWPDFAPPNPVTVQKVRDLHEVGAEIVIYTMRMSPGPIFDHPPRTAAQLVKVKEDLEAYLKAHDIPYDRIYDQVKPWYDLLLDDRAANAASEEDYRSLAHELMDQTPSKIYLKVVFDEDETWPLLSKISLAIYKKCQDLLQVDFKNVKLTPNYHVTLAYDVLGDYRFPLEAWLKARWKPVSLDVDRLDVYQHGGKDFLVLRVESTDLTALHNDIMKTFHVEQSFPYNPHITLAEFPEGQGKAFLDQIREFSDSPRSMTLSSHSLIAMDCFGEQIRFHILAPKPESPITSSLVDYPHQSLPSDLWQTKEDGKLFLIPEIADKLIQIGREYIQEALGSDFKQAPVFFIQGSSASQFYTATSDLDLLAVVTGLSAKDIEEANDKLEKLDKEHYLGGRPVELRIHDQKDLEDPEFLKEVDSFYDINNGAWFKEPEPIDPLTYNRKAVVGKASKEASKLALEWDKAFGQLNRDLHELSLVKAYLDTESEEKKKDLSAYASTLLAKCEAIVGRLWRERKELRQARKEAPHKAGGKKPYHGLSNAYPEVILYKLLTAWNYLPRIYALGRMLKDREGEFTLADVQSLQLVLDGQVPEPESADNTPVQGKFFSEKELQAFRGMDVNSNFALVLRQFIRHQRLWDLASKCQGVENFVKLLKDEQLDFKNVNPDQLYSAVKGLTETPALQGALLDDLLKEARKALEADPRFSGYQQDPVKAEALGQAQRAFADARSEGELKAAWESAGMAQSWEQFRTTIKKEERKE